MNSPAPDPTIAWNVILTIAVIGNVLMTWFAIVRSGRSQKRDVSIIESAVPRATFDKFEDTNNEEHQLLHNRITDVRDRIEEVLKEVNETQRALPNEIVALLRNTGVIK